jgi:hypothetical protein
MPNYENGKIYKIECLNGEEGDIYIGSTCKKLLSQRMGAHRSDYKRYKEGKKRYNFTSFQLFDKYGIQNCNIVLLESFSSDSKDSLFAKEAFYIKSIKCVNKFIPLRTRKEYGDDNKDKINQYQEKYYQNNKDKKAEYYQNNKDKRNQYQEKYYQNNKDRIAEYYQNNKDK